MNPDAYLGRLQMQQLTYAKKRVLQWREAPEPTLHSPQEAIVRPFVGARCIST